MSLLDSFWEGERQRLVSIFVPRLAQMAMVGMFDASRKAGVVFNQDLYSRHAEAWALATTDEILEGFINSSKTMQGTFQSGSGKILSEWIARPGATVGELNEKLAELFGRQRAATISVTEATRAFSSGEEIAYLKEGITDWAWQTNRDELVCHHCGPLHNKVVPIGAPFAFYRGKPITKPPFHPNCRCGVKPKIKNILQNQTFVLQ